MRECAVASQRYTVPGVYWVLDAPDCEGGPQLACQEGADDDPSAIARRYGGSIVDGPFDSRESATQALYRYLEEENR